MNLPGPHQRIETCFEGQKGGALLPIAFRSRPSSLRATNVPSKTTSSVRKVTSEESKSHTTAWKASVWDEVQATADGTLRRRIRILITDGTQPGSGETAWG